MNIMKVYKNLNILPSLQNHQLRVAAVAAKILDSYCDFTEINEVIAACLLHDVGNIIKFDLSLYPNFLEPKGLDFWDKVQKDFIKKYGEDEHKASVKIAMNLEVNGRIVELIKAVGFSNAEQNRKSSDLSSQTVCYSDQRVSPYGVVSLEDRITRGKERYIKNKTKTDKNFHYDNNKFETMASALRQIEKQIFDKISLSPKDVNEGSITPYFESLQKFDFDCVR